MLPPDPLFRLKADMGHVHSVCFLEDTNFGEGGGSDDPHQQPQEFVDTLVAATESGYLYFWDLERNRLRFKQQMGLSIQAVHNYKDQLLVQEKEGIITQWQKCEESEETGSDLYVKVRSTNLCAYGFCKSALYEHYLAVPQEDLSMVLFVLNEQQIDEQPLHKFVPKGSPDILGHLMCIEMTHVNDELLILGGYETGRVIAWRLQSENQVSYVHCPNICTTSLAFDNFTLKGVVANALSNIIDIFGANDKTMRQMENKGELLTTNKGCTVVRLRHDKKVMVSGGSDGRLRIYSWKTLRVLVVLADHKQSISDVQFSRKSVKAHKTPIMAAAGVDGTVSLWSLYN